MTETLWIMVLVVTALAIGLIVDLLDRREVAKSLAASRPHVLRAGQALGVLAGLSQLAGRPDALRDAAEPDDSRGDPRG